MAKSINCLPLKPNGYTTSSSTIALTICSASSMNSAASSSPPLSLPTKAKPNCCPRGCRESTQLTTTVFSSTATLQFPIIALCTPVSLRCSTVPKKFTGVATPMGAPLIDTSVVAVYRSPTTNSASKSPIRLWLTQIISRFRSSTIWLKSLSSSSPAAIIARVI